VKPPAAQRPANAARQGRALELYNGSAFTTKRFKRFCWRHGILLLHSPVRRPRYNGTCEVSGRCVADRAIRTGVGSAKRDRCVRATRTTWVRASGTV
jgi:hypothetical protein